MGRDQLPVEDQQFAAHLVVAAGLLGDAVYEHLEGWMHARREAHQRTVHRGRGRRMLIPQGYPGAS